MKNRAVGNKSAAKLNGEKKKNVAFLLDYVTINHQVQANNWQIFSYTQFAFVLTI